MAFITVTNTFSNGSDSDADQVNNNFTDIINGTSDGTKAFTIALLTATAITTSGRIQGSSGASIASANDITLGSDGNFFEITGTTTVNRILTTGWQTGSIIHLYFSGLVTVTNGTSSGSGFQGFRFASDANTTSSGADGFTMTFSNTGSVWLQMGGIAQLTAP